MGVGIKTYDGHRKLPNCKIQGVTLGALLLGYFLDPKIELNNVSPSVSFGSRL